MTRPAAARKSAAAVAERPNVRILPENGERKILALTNLADTQQSDDAPFGGFTGYGSVFGNVDSYGDIVVKGAYAATMPTFVHEGFIAWQHGWQSEPIGTVKAAHEDDVGLWIDVEYHSTDFAQNIRKIVSERLERKKTMGLSIGYTVEDCDYREDGVRILKKINLFEVSLVNMPANRIAQVTEAKRLVRLGKIAAKEIGDLIDGGDEDDGDLLSGDAGADGEDEGEVEGDSGDPDNIQPFGDDETFEGGEPETAGRRISAEVKGIKTTGGLHSFALMHPDRKWEVLAVLSKSPHGHETKAGKYDAQCPRCRWAADLMRELGQPDPVLDRANDGTDPDAKAKRESKSMNLTAEKRASLLKALDLPDEATDASIEAALAALHGQNDEKHDDAAGEPKSLPNSAYGYVQSAAKDKEGAEPTRLFLHHDADGGVDLPLLRKALVDLPATDVPEAVRPLIREHLQKHADEKGIDEELDDAGYVPDHLDDAAMTLAAEADHALARVDSLLARARAATELRAKEGRPLSSNNRTRLRNQRTRLAEVLDEIDKLLTETDRDKPAKKPKAALLAETQETVRDQANRALESISEADTIDATKQGDNDNVASRLKAVLAMVEVAETAVEAIEDGVTDIVVQLDPTFQPEDDDDEDKSGKPAKVAVKSPPTTLLEAVQAAHTVMRQTRLMVTRTPEGDTLPDALTAQIGKAAAVLALLKEQVDDWTAPTEQKDSDQHTKAIRDVELEALATMARVTGL